MKTTRKQLINFAIGLVKEVASQNRHIEIQYRKDAVIIWFYCNNDSLVEGVYLYSCKSLKENKQLFRKAILKIRGIIL